MRTARLSVLAVALAGAVACGELVLPADPTHEGINPPVNSSGGGAVTGTRTVTVGDNFFSPDTLAIFVSDTVTWVWTGINPHSVTFPDGITSGDRTSGTFQRFFGSAGTFPYSSSTPGDSALTGAITVLNR